MKVYRFAGPIKSLIPAGWKFHKVHGMNYKAYNKGDIWLFVISKMMVEIDNFSAEQQKIVIDFILKNKCRRELFWLRKPSGKGISTTYRSPRWCIINNQVVHWKTKFKIYKETGEMVYEKQIFMELVNLIKELETLGGLELTTII